MALARYQCTITDAAGNVISGASVEVRREVTGLPLVQLWDDEIPADSLEPLLDRVARYAVGFGPSRRLVSQRLVDAAHARDLVVHPYTVNAESAMSFLLGLGVDGMFTDRPAALRQLLQR